MNCFEVRGKIGRYADEELPKEQMLEISSHLQDCSSCSLEFQYLSQIESLARHELHSEPAKEYWDNLPQKIVARIGLKPPKSVFQNIADNLNELVFAKTFRWGLAGALALIALVILFKDFQITTTEMPAISEKSYGIEESTSETSLADVSDDTKSPTPGEASQNLVSEPSTPSQQSSAGNKDEHTDEVVQELNYNVIAMNDITPMPVRNTLSVSLNTNEELVPLPNSEFLIPTTEMYGFADDSDSQFEVDAFALDQSGKSFRNVNEQSTPAKMIEDESDFAETMWIVQESETLGEKKNIWLSYISRETDTTYQSLGIYNLALVMAKIAEETKDADKAKEALEFFAEHESSLRFQMSDNRYEIKLNALKLIANIN